MLSESSPLTPEELAETSNFSDMGLSSLQVLIFAAKVEAEFSFRFDDGEIAEIATLEDLINSVATHTESA